MPVEVNEYLENILLDAGCGKFQIIFYVLVYGSMVPATFSTLMMTFAGVEPTWSCDWNTITGERVNVTAPLACSVENRTDKLICSSKSFDHSISTIVNEWDLTCDKEWKISTVATIQLGGLLIGAFISGQFGDVFGRKPTFFISFAILFICNIAAAYSVSWRMFAIMMFFSGFGSGWYLTIYIIVLAELTPAKYRSVAVACPAWPIGTMLFGLCCLIINDWQYIQITTAVLCMPWILGVCIIPESYRWLVSKNRCQEANDALDKIFRINGKQIPDKVVLREALKLSQTKEKDRQSTVVDILKTRKLLKNTGLLLFCWISCGYGYFAISFGVQQLSGNLYINIVLLGLVDTVQIIVSYITNRIGRKKTTFIFFVIAGLTGVSVGIIQFLDVQDKGKLINWFAFTSKLCVNSGWISLIIFTSELYPTVVRNVGFGLNNAVARVGAMLAPQLVYASKHIPGISYFLLGGLFLLSGISILLLPETNKKALRDTIDDIKEETTDL